VTSGYTAHHGTYLAHRITLEGRGEDAFAKSLDFVPPDAAPAKRRGRPRKEDTGPSLFGDDVEPVDG